MVFLFLPWFLDSCRWTDIPFQAIDTLWISGEQIVCPKPTRRWLISLQSSLGIQDSSSLSVSTGFLVSFGTH